MMLLRRNKYHFKKTWSAKKLVNSKLQWCLPLYRSIPMVHLVIIICICNALFKILMQMNFETEFNVTQ